MLNPSLSERLRKKQYMSQYLSELSILMGYPVQAGELGGLDQAGEIRAAVLAGTAAQAGSRFELSFSEVASERFKRYLQRLIASNPSPVYVWTPRTIDCGALTVDSLLRMNFNFPFNINEEGIIAFVTNDVADRMLLEFSINSVGQEVLIVETQGPNWASAMY